jgi:hypothetical protein
MVRTLALLRAFLLANSLYQWAAAGGAIVLMTAAVQVWSSYPQLAGALALAATLLAISAAWGFVFVPKKGTCWPPWWNWWYLNPIRKIAWRFGHVLQITDLPDRSFVVFEFTCSLRVNRGRVVPKRFVLESTTGRIVPLMIQSGPQYLLAEEVAYIPADTWHYCRCRLLLDERMPDDGHTNHPRPAEFFRTFDELTLIFEYDTGAFRKRFQRSTLKSIVEFYIEKHTPRVRPMAVPRPRTNP